MRIAVTGSSGLIGSALVPALEADGHEVVRLVRRQPTGGGEVRWDPSGGTVDAASLTGVEAVVHLAGASIDRRWSDGAKRRIRDSRVSGTRLIAETAATLDPRPRTLVCASASGYYGNRGDEQLSESEPAGDGFLARVVQEWEAAAQPARDNAIRVVHLRQGLVLSRRGGALRRMLLPFRLGLGGRVASGRQWWSWVLLDDVVSAYRHALESELSGPTNVALASTSGEFVKALGRALRRPTVFPVPALAVRLAFGQMGEELLVWGQRLSSERLRESGFRFAHAELEQALAHAVRD